MSSRASSGSVAVTRGMLVPFAAMSASYFAHIGFFNPYLPLWLKDLGYPIAVISVRISSLESTLSSRAFSVLMSLPRSGRMA